MVAALSGATLGGGAETALACHYRCAAGDLQLGFPEVNLGLLPGAGGTVRLPRLAGWQAALELMTSGRPIGIDAAIELGIVDRRVDGELAAGAIAWARELARAGAPPRRVLDLPVPASRPAQFEEFLRALPASSLRLPAPPRIVEALASAAILPAEVALARARALFLECVATTESRSLRHLFFAERRPVPDRGMARAVGQAAVLGAGTMGSGIAISLASGGIPVILIDAKQEALDAGLARVKSSIDAAERKGRLDANAATAARGRVQGSLTLAAASGADLVIEAVFESLAVKREVFGRLGPLCRPGAVLATNTSTLDVDAIAEASGRPADVVGMHFFSPANVMRLVEVVRGGASSREAIATAHAVARRIGKIGIPVGNAFGFVGNRMLYAYGREKELMLLEGARPRRSTRRWWSSAWPWAPTRSATSRAWTSVSRCAGNGRGSRTIHVTTGPRTCSRNSAASARRPVAASTGTTGRAANACRIPEVTELIRAEAARLGVAPRSHSSTEIVTRAILALVNEGARVLEEGIAESPADIDVIWCNGYGFPRHRGGPMFYADTIGLPAVLESINALGREHGERYWTPAPLLVTLAGEGATFSAWQAARAPQVDSADGRE